MFPLTGTRWVTRTVRGGGGERGEEEEEEEEEEHTMVVEVEGDPVVVAFCEAESALAPALVASSTPSKSINCCSVMVASAPP